uniref:Uncharacterized protein n=1 Tax=Panagrellus redivivus TaxID=6233 RepID=A0A7E4VXY6_PANRE
MRCPKSGLTAKAWNQPSLLFPYFFSAVFSLVSHCFHVLLIPTTCQSLIKLIPAYFDRYQMPELKTHLLFEALDIAFDKTRRQVAWSALFVTRPTPEVSFWKLSDPEAVCALAISSSHGYRMIAYILKHFAKRISEEANLLTCDSRIWGPGYHDIEVLRFSPKYHVRALMNVAGRFCTNIQRGKFPESDGFTDLFYDGLAFNEGLSAREVYHCQKLFRAYIKGRQFFHLDDFSLSYFNRRDYNCLYDAGDAIITFLNVSTTDPNEAITFACFKDLKIQNLIVNAYETTVYRDIFVNATPQLSYMQRLTIYAKLSIVTAINMFHRYHIDWVIMNRIRLINSKLPFDELVDQWRAKLDTLWNAIMINKGTKVVVRVFGNNTFKNVSLTTMVDKLNEALPDYEVECTHYIQCRYSKVFGSKSMDVKLEFYSRW